MFAPGIAYKPILMFASKAEAYPSEASEMCRLLALPPANITLGLKGLLRTNTLAY